MYTPGDAGPLVSLTCLQKRLIRFLTSAISLCVGRISSSSSTMSGTFQNSFHASFPKTSHSPASQAQSLPTERFHSRAGPYSRLSPALSGVPRVSFATPYPRFQQTQRQLQSVVTTSFSVEDERDESAGMNGNGWGQSTDRSPASESHFHMPSQNKTPTSRQMNQGQLRRSYSTEGGVERFAQGEPLKRNYFHHVHPGDAYTGPVSPDFMPPKRVKTSHSLQNETAMYTNRSEEHRSCAPSGWSEFPPSWELSEGPFERHLTRTQSLPPLPPWNRAQAHASKQITYEHDGVYHHSSGNRDSYHPHWNHMIPKLHTWGRPGPFWSRPPPIESHARRDEEAEKDWVESREPASERYPLAMEHRDFEPPYHNSKQHSRPSEVMHIDAEAAVVPENTMLYHGKSVFTNSTIGANSATSRVKKTDKIFLLALPQDKLSLSETLCIVRENIEVFTATQCDVDAPAPGRKHAVTVGQVGLRCIYCRHTTRSSDRVKRAVCYPSSIKRIYRTVIDMKLDHFSLCKFVPTDLKTRLDDLKSIHTRSTGTTMQYFIEAASSLGMADGPSGVRLIGPSNEEAVDVAVAPTRRIAIDLTQPPSLTEAHNTESAMISRSESILSTSSSENSSTMSIDVSMASSNGNKEFDPTKYYMGSIPLFRPEDTMALSPLRCFLREQVCAFSATEEDIAVRAPTTFSISVGQVGIGCVHCLQQHSRLRSNRAVCFPFSIGRIYQSVADIQRFHFNECPNLPVNVKERFLVLQSASSKGSKGLATRQYWVTSGKKLGLVDTPRGIRFCRDPCAPVARASFSLDILAQAAFSVTTAGKQLVHPEDKEYIAEFLYMVMEQLQPCRFTEADRNKRRLKDVGYIGVECKHCSGHVDSRKFFWSSVNAVESNFVSVHTHMLECRMIPDRLKDRLLELKQLRKEQTAALKTGSQKAFFARVWQRLHDDEDNTYSDFRSCLHRDDEMAPELPDQQNDAKSANNMIAV